MLFSLASNNTTRSLRLGKNYQAPDAVLRAECYPSRWVFETQAWLTLLRDLTLKGLEICDVDFDATIC